MDSGAALDMPATGIIGTKFDQVVVLGEYGRAIGGPTVSSTDNSAFDQSWRNTAQARAALGPVGVEVAGHPNIFPTTWIAVSVQLSLRIPRDPGHTEIWWFTFVDRNLPRETRDFLVTVACRILGRAAYSSRMTARIGRRRPRRRAASPAGE